MSNYYRPGFGGFSFFPPVIKNLLIINGVVFFLQILMQNLMFNGVPASYILSRWFALNPLGDGGNFQIWQLITYQFMHGGFSHILFNMFALWMFGVEIENLWGSKKFLIFYLLAGVTGGLAQLLISPLLGGGNAATIGASGAVFGILLAFALLFPNRYIFLYFFIPIKAKYLIAFLIVMEILLVDSAGSGVAHLAHLGGALYGLLYLIFDKRSNISFGEFFGTGSGGTGSSSGFGGFADKFKRRDDVEDATYYDIDNKKDKKDDEEVSQEELDKILDKISKTGYQNLSEREKKILFEISKKMNQN